MRGMGVLKRMGTGCACCMCCVRLHVCLYVRMRPASSIQDPDLPREISNSAVTHELIITFKGGHGQGG